MSAADFHDPACVRRRTRLRELLVDPPRPLEMSMWANCSPYEEPTCGTAACALGTAALDPELQNQGLTLQPGVIRQGMVLTVLQPTFKEYRKSAAGAAFFGISPEAAEFLFVVGYRCPLDMVRASDVLKVLDGIERDEGHMRFKQAANGIWWHTSRFEP